MIRDLCITRILVYTIVVKTRAHKYTRVLKLAVYRTFHITALPLGWRVTN
jgi:hypothetical protein